MRQPSSTFHLADDRIERAVGVLGRAEVAEASVRFGTDALKKRHREPRLANACLTGQEHYLSFAGLCLGPAPKKKFEFFFPTDKLG
jgi:hypothetical protein